jgi:hypothetical protein
MTGPVCVIPSRRCPHEDPVQLHHALGRGADGRYIKPEILVPLCQPDCHKMGIHAVLRSAGLDGPMEPTPGVLVGRLGCTLGWIGGRGKGDVTLPAKLLCELAEVLGPISRELRRAETST